jgi:predicted dehydrogenase
MTALRVACVGAGYFSRFQYEAWSRMPDVTLVAMANRSVEKTPEIASAYGITATYADPIEMIAAGGIDLLDIITPPETHLALIRAATAAGLHITCQKPFCANLAEAAEATRLAEAAGVHLVVHENFRFQPWYREIARLIDSGALGDVYQTSFRMRTGDGQGPRAYLDRQAYFQKMPRFLVHETAVHWVDTFRFLHGQVHAVTARLRQLNPAIAGEDAGIILFEFAGGPMALYDGNRLSDHLAENRRLTFGDALVEGSAGSIRLTGDGKLWRRAFGSNTEAEHPYQWQNRGFAGDCVYALQRHVVDAIMKCTKLENSARDYLGNIVVEEAIYCSHDTGTRVQLEPGQG